MSRRVARPNCVFLAVVFRVWSVLYATCTLDGDTGRKLTVTILLQALETLLHFARCVDLAS